MPRLATRGNIEVHVYIPFLSVRNRISLPLDYPAPALFKRKIVQTNPQLRTKPLHYSLVLPPAFRSKFQQMSGSFSSRNFSRDSNLAHCRGRNADIRRIFPARVVNFFSAPDPKGAITQRARSTNANTACTLLPAPSPQPLLPRGLPTKSSFSHAG